MKHKYIFTLVFVAVSLAEIICDLQQLHVAVYILKPLILSSLILYTNFTEDLRTVRNRSFFNTALFFALLGDVFLMIRETDLFIPGLAAFLVMQLLYTFSFAQEISAKVISKNSLTKFLPFLTFAAVFFPILNPYLPGGLKPAVGIYACCIAVMSWMSFLRRNYVSALSFRMVFSGALLFMISDSLIAVDRFVHPLPYNTIWVMGTYATAQYMISMGYLKTK